MCEICGRNPCIPLCPNYTPKEANCYCFVCGEGIYMGDTYIENDIGDCIHYDCIHDMYIHDLVEWFGGKIKTMEDDYGEDY